MGLFSTLPISDGSGGGVVGNSHFRGWGLHTAVWFWVHSLFLNRPDASTALSCQAGEPFNVLIDPLLKKKD